MKKKLLALALILVIATSSIFATNLIQIGPTAEIPLPLGSSSMEEIGHQFTLFNNYRFGADARLTIPMGDFLGLQFGGNALIGFNFDPTVFDFNTDGTINLVFFNSSNVNFSLGLGQNMLIRYANDAWTFSGSDNFIDALTTSPFIYRAGVNVKLGLTLGFFYVVPTFASYSNFSFEALEPVFENGKVGVSVLLFNLF